MIRDRQQDVVVILAVALGTAIVSGAAVAALRYVLRQDLVESAAAQSVIRIAKLRATAERLGARARAVLLGEDLASLRRLEQVRTTFFTQLDGLPRPLDAETIARVDQVREAARQYDLALDSVVALRRRDEFADVARAVEKWVRPRRDAFDDALSRLGEGEEARLHALDRFSERTASVLATISAGVALGALLVALAMGMMLIRAFSALRLKREELERTMVRLAKANDDLEAFAGRIAHDLRTPLTPVILLAGKLKLSNDEGVVRTAERIERSAGNAGRMVDELLALSRLGRRSEGITLAAAAVRDTLQDMLERITDGGITVETELDPNVSVACSEALFRQVVANLLGNAVKALANRSERRLFVGVRASRGSCELTVRDTGPGMPPEVLARVFQPFYRAPGNRAPGSGLGLAIVQRIVDVHEGSVSAESQPGTGSTFRVVLPAAATAAAVPARAPPRPGAAPARG